MSEANAVPQLTLGFLEEKLHVSFLLQVKGKLVKAYIKISGTL